VLIAEQELPIEVAQVDGVEVYDVDFAEAGENEVFEELAANAASPNHQYARLQSSQSAVWAQGWAIGAVPA